MIIRLILTVIFFLHSCAYASQGMMGPGISRQYIIGSSVSDDFNRSNENPLSGNWSFFSGMNPLKLSNNAIEPTSAIGLSIWNAIVFSSNQYSSVKIVTNDNACAGPAVRVSYTGSALTGGYYAAVNDGDLKIVRLGNNAAVLNSSVCTEINITGEIIKLSAYGSSPVTLKAYVNGLQCGSDVIDASIYQVQTGQPGIITTTGGVLDDWTGGDL